MKLMKDKVSDLVDEIRVRLNKLFAAEAQAEAEGNSKESAKDRLKLVLMHDRSKLSADDMAKMRDELVEVIAKYVEIDREALDLNLADEQGNLALIANIPVLRTK